MKLSVVHLAVAFCWLLSGTADFAAAQAVAQSAPSRVQFDVPYKTTGTDYEIERCKLDLYLPADEQEFATLIYFHGGGLRAGDKGGDATKRISRRLAEEGIAVVTPNYRLSPRVNYPAYLEDAAAAVAWVRSNIGEYGGTPSKLFVSGHSAGGYVTAMLGMAEQFLGQHGISLSEMRGFIPISGQMDCHSQIRAERSIEGNPSIVDDTAPLFYVSKDKPPMLVVVGGEDLPGREEINLHFAEKLADAGHDATELLVVADRNHGSIIGHVDDPDDVVAERILDFIERYSRGDLPVREEIGTTDPVHRCGSTYLAGQPSPEDLKLFREQGVKTIISLRTEGELDWDEGAAVRQLGMEFVHIPFRRADTLTDEVFDKALAVLRNPESQPAVLHCGRANRVGAIWMAYRALDDGMSLEAAQQEAEATGLRTPALAERAKEYVRKQRGD